MKFNISNDDKYKAGIYKIINSENGKFYIGSSKNLYVRYCKHLNDLKNKNHHSILLQRAFNKYGIDSFEFNLVEIINDITDLLNSEQTYLNLKEQSYNIALYANAPTKGLSYPCKPETKLKISIAHKGKKKSENHVKNMVKSHEKYEYIITKPNSEIEITRNLNEFIKVNNLPTNIYKIANGGYVTNSTFYPLSPEYNGYKFERRLIDGSIPDIKFTYSRVAFEQDNRRATWLALDSDNNEYHIENLKEHCKKYNLNYTSLKGRWNVKGWVFCKLIDSKEKTLEYLTKERQRIINHNVELKQRRTERILKVSEQNKGKTLSESHRQKIGAASLGKTHTDKTKEKLRQINLGKKHDEAFGLKIAHSKSKLEYVAISPENIKYEIPIMSLFCKEHKLNQDKMRRVANKNEFAHKGWLCFLKDEFIDKDYSEELAKAKQLTKVITYEITLPDGSKQVVDNISTFAKKHSLLTKSLTETANPNRRVKSYKGYSAKKLT